MQVNGIQLAVAEYGPADGPVVVLLHGFPELGFSWRHQIRPLAAAGYRLLEDRMAAPRAGARGWGPVGPVRSERARAAARSDA